MVRDVGLYHTYFNLNLINMKTLNLIIAALFLNLFAFAQPAKKPSIMVIPSKTICKSNNCMKSTTVYGETKEYPDYRKAVEIEEINIEERESEFLCPPCIAFKKLSERVLELEKQINKIMNILK